jgi:acyl-CoA synthetase (NDP forming)
MKFLNPKSIAIVGASNNEDKVGGILFKKIKNFKGKIYPINPSSEFVQGVKSYNTLKEISAKIDLVVIAVPKDIVEDIVMECSEIKVKNIIIISAGFSEIGNKEAEEKIISIAKRNNIRILGPNCFGICLPKINLDCTFSLNTPKLGNTAFIGQSGALWSYVSEIGKFSGYASLGNMADLNFNDFIEYFSGDKQTKNIILYIEKIKNGRKFIEVCKKSKKKIFAIKAGSSIEGKKAAISHTGSLATDYAVYKGVLKQAGITLCKTIEEAVEKSGIFLKKEKKEPVYLNEVEIVTNAGGAGVLVSDYLSEKEIKIKKINDILGTARSGDYKKAIEETSAQEIMVILTPQYLTEIDKTAEILKEYKKKSKKKIYALFLGGKSMKRARQILKDDIIPCFKSFEEIIKYINKKE